MNTVIIGGSNTGLMNGIVLKRLGHNVRILEQNPESKRDDFAAGITTHPIFEEFMERHDRTAESWSIHSPGVQFLDKAAAVTRHLNKALQMTSWGVIYHHLRANFDGFSSNFCPNPPEPEKGDGVTVFDCGKRVTGLRRITSGVEITYEDLLNQKEKGTLLADIVMVANGANSALRSAIFTGVERLYAGYIIPGTDGSIVPGHRRYNWVWYHPVTAGSPELENIMTDTSGVVHRNTLPVGTMQPSEWAAYIVLASKVMCPPFAEMVQKTTQPFITAISDVSCPRATAFNGTVLIVGEALNLMRPHMALSTTQSAMQALMLEKFFKREITLSEWEKQVLHYGCVGALKTNAFGSFFLYGYLSSAGWLVKLASSVLGSLPPFSWLSDMAEVGSTVQK
ncbi:2,6-dihydroxypyridine 3-monooxygenase [Lachnellula subtilissima]|uniref:2,6-dihydroxypyridine 3-monooxygenase n=1 Tax=Lachnellula subtilissima TaxID=602034 RepID=A0A8H8RZ27_9HELO|nr:2,6-dihydroxypyridine 3-monooxygenase [Lachnellula subtilissima]